MKSPFCTAIREEFSCIGNPPFVNIHAKSVASHLSKGEKIFAVAATYLQNAAVLTKLFELPDIRYKVFPTGLCQFVEIESPVLVTFLHVLYLLFELEIKPIAKLEISPKAAKERTK